MQSVLLYYKLYMMYKLIKTQTTTASLLFLEMFQLCIPVLECSGCWGSELSWLLSRCWQIPCRALVEQTLEVLPGEAPAERWAFGCCQCGSLEGFLHEGSQVLWVGL